jgi:hypothetical protein
MWYKLKSLNRFPAIRSERADLRVRSKLGSESGLVETCPQLRRSSRKALPSGPQRIWLAFLAGSGLLRGPVVRRWLRGQFIDSGAFSWTVSTVHAMPVSRPRPESRRSFITIRCSRLVLARSV